MKLLLITLSVLLISGCNQKSKETKHNLSKAESVSLGKYLYIDNASVIHSKTGCNAIYKNHNMQFVDPVEPECLSFESLSKICSRCFSEKMVDSLRIIFSDYRQSYINVGNLYDDLISREYDIPSEMQFRKYLRDEEMVKRVYQIALEENGDPGSYADFLEWVGYSKPAKRKTKSQL